MKLHILGIAGTFMGGVAALARELGHEVEGSDQAVYPPMSTQLEQLGIALQQGYLPGNISPDCDMVVVGNALSRGNPAVEAVLDSGRAYTSGAEWLRDNVLPGRDVLAVAGTHGKTTTTTILSYLLEAAGLAPGFLIGGVAEDFGVSARLGGGRPFVVEADEYDTAFFDKRSKFVHYHAKKAVLNNLEYDHADIFPDIGAIETQFHHLVRTVPGVGRLIVNGDEASLGRVIKRGCWSEKETFGAAEGVDWSLIEHPGGSSFDVLFNRGGGPGEHQGTVHWELTGHHNRSNAMAAIAAARHVGVPAAQAIDSLSRFQSVKRRMEVRGVVNQVTVYDDFAHHPTAIATTVGGLRQKIGTSGRILAVLEPRSNTMKLGAMKDALPGSLKDADLVFGFGSQQALGWSLADALKPLGAIAHSFDQLDYLVQAVVQAAQPGDHILVMSNGGFGGVHQKLLDALAP